MYRLHLRGIRGNRICRDFRFSWRRVWRWMSTEMSTVWSGWCWPMFRRSFRVIHYPDDRGCKLLRNFDQYLPDYTVQHKTAIFIINLALNFLTLLAPVEIFYFCYCSRNNTELYGLLTLLFLWHVITTFARSVVRGTRASEYQTWSKIFK
jgi:hypothetical protein